jgi:hypothetical protein
VTPLTRLAAAVTTHLSQFAPEQREEEACALLEHVSDLIASTLQDLDQKEDR